MDKLEHREGVYSKDCTNCEKKYFHETKRKLAVSVKEYKEEVEKITKSRVYTSDSQTQLEGDRWKLVITDHAVQSNHIIDQESAKIVT